MPTYVLRNGQMVDQQNGTPMNIGPWAPTAPIIIHDIAPYQSPVDGGYVGGRRAKRDDLKAHNCIDAADLPSPTGGGFRNKRFCAKRGLQVSEEYR